MTTSPDNTFSISHFLEQLQSTPDNVQFKNTMAVIDEHYRFCPSEFQNGDLINAENQNSGSCKIFFFAQLHNLSEQQTLHCFGDYYRVDVLQNPNGTDHQNIRNFIKQGWAGITFKHPPLSEI